MYINLKVSELHSHMWKRYFEMIIGIQVFLFILLILLYQKETKMLIFQMYILILTCFRMWNCKVLFVSLRKRESSKCGTYTYICFYANSGLMTKETDKSPLKKKEKKNKYATPGLQRGTGITNPNPRMLESKLIRQRSKQIVWQIYYQHFKLDIKA